MQKKLHKNLPGVFLRNVNIIQNHQGLEWYFWLAGGVLPSTLDTVELYPVIQRLDTSSRYCRRVTPMSAKSLPHSIHNKNCRSCGKGVWCEFLVQTIVVKNMPFKRAWVQPVMLNFYEKKMISSTTLRFSDPQFGEFPELPRETSSSSFSRGSWVWCSYWFS